MMTDETAPAPTWGSSFVRGLAAIIGDAPDTAGLLPDRDELFKMADRMDAVPQLAGPVSLGQVGPVVVEQGDRQKSLVLVVYEGACPRCEAGVSVHLPIWLQSSSGEA